MPGLGFAVAAGTRYRFSFIIYYSAAAISAGSRGSINGPVATLLAYSSEYSLTTATCTTNNGNTAYNLPTAANASSATTESNTAKIEGIVTPSAAGTVIARFASELASAAITAIAGSCLEWRRSKPLAFEPSRE